MKDQVGPPGTDSVDRLDSWKEIAAYLNRDVRTVQRWELEDGFPVRRIKTKKRANVFAYKSDIDAWLKKVDSAEQKLEKARSKAFMFVPIAACVVLASASLFWWATDSPLRPVPAPAAEEPQWVLIAGFDWRMRSG